MNSKTWLGGAVVLALGFTAGLYLSDSPRLSSDGGNGMAPDKGGQAAPGQREVLYWVAPMDPNFRRDQPGKSPMGMDLVPVYAGEADAGEVVRIDPAVVQNLGVRTATVERGRLWRRIDTVGYVGFDERRISHVHLRTEGWIDKLHVKSDGERVRQGEVLMKVYSRDLVNAQEEYLQALRTQGGRLRQASHDRLLALGMSAGQIEEIAKTGRAVQLVRIVARQSGIVSGLNIREGMFVTPAMELLTLADLSSVWLLVDVFERQAEWVRVGMPAEVEVPYLPGEVWEGKVEFIYPRIDPKTRTLRVRVRFDNPEEVLKPDMYAQVRIYAGPKGDVLSIPHEALIRTGNSERVVIALGEGRFASRTVVAGMESGDWVEIIEGLETGEQVVTSGQFLLDSEASLKASFARMGSEPEEESPAVEPAPVTGMGRVNEVFAEDRKLNLTHGSIEALGWPAMTMDFRVSDGVDLSTLLAGQEVHFVLVEDTAGSYRINGIQVIE